MTTMRWDLNVFKTKYNIEDNEVASFDPQMTPEALIPDTD